MVIVKKVCLNFCLVNITDPDLELEYEIFTFLGHKHTDKLWLL
jgi:hypothetical protein